MSQNYNPDHELINREDTIFVVIDVQEKLIPAIHSGEMVVANTATLTTFCGIAGIPIIFTEQQKLGPTLSDVRQACRTFSAIEKVHFNCFFNPIFAQEIQNARRKTLVIAGVESHICVAQTAIWAAREFNVHVISDAVSSRVPDNKAIAIQRMRDAGAVISSTEMFIYEILVQAGTDEFKSVLPLVK